MHRQQHLKNHSREALRERFRADGLPAYRADQVLRWLYVQAVEDWSAMSDLPLALREQLAADWQTRALDCVHVARSQDGTCKATLRAHDGAVVEAVLIPEERRQTLCISSQVGCPLACSFCATGALGFARNLTTAEIVDQVCRMQELLDPDERITNVVFMGMGEPLLNLPAVAEAIRILTDPKLFALAPRRITVSTAGVVSRIEALLDIAPVHLAVSLHAPTDAVRDVLVPLNRRFPLADLIATLRELDGVSPRRPVFFEYTLIDGVNDSERDAERLVALLRGLPCKLNVIPMNPHPDAPHGPPPSAVVDRFTARVHAGGLRVTLRRNRGTDIDAACGQLAAREAAAAVDRAVSPG
ncbi:MAG: 23S rRNA (adenine(2503)-C(2))-methyltransferase RlmN [Proteobacteria bacterium]|nr:23S rRNA (adenine(2503)-C(2))-methyltransferase RlmN [Pseudomonadota bacterium]